MTMDRRRLFAAFAGAASAGAGNAATPALARDPRPFAPLDAGSSLSIHEIAPRSVIDAATLGVRPDAADDQSASLQRAIDRAAAARAVLQLPPGNYRAGALQLPPYAAIAGVAGATRLVMTGGPSLFASTGSDHVSLRGLVLDGAGRPLPASRGLVHLTQGDAVRVADCEIVGAGGYGIVVEGVAGEVTGSTISTAATGAIWSIDARGLRIANNFVRGAGDSGIQVWRSTPGDDGTLIVDNRIDDINNTSGGNGQWGNAIGVFRAHNVMVRGNRIHHAAFSAIRGNSSSNLQILGNTCTKLGEVAIFSEFGFEGAIIANNFVDGASVGVSVTNFEDHGGRLATVQGNIIRNLVAGRPAANDQSNNAAYGITVEADTAVSGNVIENIEGVGIAAGWGKSLRDVAISANIVRNADYGIAVSVVPGAGVAVISDNLISGARLGAIVGREWTKLVAADLSGDGAARYAQLSIGGNSIR